VQLFSNHQTRVQRGALLADLSTFRQSGLELEIMLQSLERLENNKEDAYDVIYIRLFTYLAVLLKIPKFVKVP
jgi:hypothetical protein